MVLSHRLVCQKAALSSALAFPALPSTLVRCLPCSTADLQTGVYCAVLFVVKHSRNQA